MAKTNFTKVEEALDTGLRDIKLKELRHEADQLKKPVDASTSNLAEERRHRQQTLKITVEWTYKADKSLYQKLGITRSEFKRLVGSVEPLTDQDWEKIKSLLEQAEKIKSQVEKTKGIQDNEALITQQRRKHVTKRFNVQEKWLPLQ